METSFVEDESGGDQLLILAGDELRASQHPALVNHERAANLSTSTGVRWLFECARISGATGKCDSLSVPSAASPPISVVSDVWFVWPVNAPLFPGAPSSASRVAYATMQLLTRASGAAGVTVVVFAQTEGVDPELALALGAGDSLALHSAANVTVEGELTVLRGLTLGHAPCATVVRADGTRAQLVALPFGEADTVWVERVGSVDRILVSADAALLLGEGNGSGFSLNVRTAFTLSDSGAAKSVALSIFPAPSAIVLATTGAKLLPSADGVFQKFIVPVASPALVAPSVRLTSPAAPPRVITKPHGKAQEPTLEDWVRYFSRSYRARAACVRWATSNIGPRVLARSLSLAR